MPTLLTWVFEGLQTDKSECERVFSLMNDLKTAERSLLKQETLKNLMLWHSLATKVVDGKRTHLDCKEVPVMAILNSSKSSARWRASGGATPTKARRLPSTSTRSRSRWTRTDRGVLTCVLSVCVNSV